MKHRTDSFTTRDKLRLFAQHWETDGTAIGRVVIVHGIVEHSGRYAETAAALVQAGFSVSAFDLRGHGRSEGPRCSIHNFDEYVEDLLEFIDQFHEPKRFLLGHSMGGLIVLRAGLRASLAVDGLIITGPALQVGSNAFPWLRKLAPLGSLLFPWLRLTRMTGSNLSRDPTVVQTFRDDPLVFHGRFPVRTGAEVLRAGAETLRRASSITHPLWIGHGLNDRVCDPAGSRQLIENCGSTDKTLREYEGLYHAILHEPERVAIRQEIIEWLRR